MMQQYYICVLFLLFQSLLNVRQCTSLFVFYLQEQITKSVDHAMDMYNPSGIH